MRKNFEHRSTFAKVIIKHQVASFLRQCTFCILIYLRLVRILHTINNVKNTT